MSPAATAGRNGLSQTRVRQLMKRVIEFLVRAVPDDLPERSKEQRLYVAEQLARMHLEHLYTEAVEMWQTSKQASGAGGLGKACYLSAATRIIGAMAKVPVHGLPDFAPDPREYDIVEMDPDGDPRQEYNAYMAEYLERDADAKLIFDAMYPPVRACSADGVSRGPIDPKDYYARHQAATTYGPASGPLAGLSGQNFAPAQAGGSPVGKPSPKPSDRSDLAGETANSATQKPGDSPPRGNASPESSRQAPPAVALVPLTRQQRRSRERLLRQKLGKNE